MSATVLTVSSITYAIKARKTLKRIGIQAKLVKIEDGDSINGCAYAIEFNSKDLYAAIAELKKNNIDYSFYKTRNKSI